MTELAIVISLAFDRGANAATIGLMLASRTATN
jgi:hypothetical protein